MQVYNNRIYDNEGYILKAGGLILKDNKILLLYRKKLNDWSFPKGHLEPNETIEECLKREVLEETGLKVRVGEPLSDIFYTYPEGDGNVRIKMFICRPVSDELLTEYKGDNLKWFNFNDALEKLSYANNKELLKEVKKVINV